MPFFTLKVEMVEWHSRYGESATCVVSASWWFISFDPLSSPRIPFVCVPSFSIHLSSFDMKGVCASPKQQTREWKIVRFVLLNCFFMSPQKKGAQSMLMQFFMWFLNTLLWRLGWRTIDFVYASTYDHTKAQQWTDNKMPLVWKQFNQSTELHRLMGTFFCVL